MSPRSLPICLAAMCVIASCAVLAQQPGYVVRGEDPQTLVKEQPELPSLDRYSAAAIKAKIGSRQPGLVSIERMVNLAPLDEFTGGDGRLALWAERQTRNPRAIVIRDGYVTPADIADALDSSAFVLASSIKHLNRF